MPEETGLKWFQLLAAMVPAISAPFIAWFLSQRGVSRQSKEFEWLLNRTELVERLRAFIEHRDEVGKKNVIEALNAEVDDILGDLSALRESERERERLARIATTERIPRWRHFLLLYEQASLSASIYRVLFYLFLIWTMLIGAVMIDELVTIWDSRALLTPDPSFSFDFNNRILTMIIMMGVNLTIGLLFRVAAVRTHKKKLKKSLAAQGSDT
ncbi:MAG: hypothetical protein JSU77_03610 [Fidelibacterota bacterium]|nr:MAG: hypothetical protein JSU77_03610 [Candidatus Neomarinimicrobiota bacterium]